MAILDRVKTRIETDIDDGELQLMIDEANQAIINRYGLHPNPSTPVTETLEGHRRNVVLSRPIDVGQSVSVTEEIDEFGVATYALGAFDFRIWPPYILERRADGTNARRYWGDRVVVTYTPVNDGDQREEVIIKLVVLSIQYEGVSVRTVGDVSANNLDYASEREKLLRSLAPKQGFMFA